MVRPMAPPPSNAYYGEADSDEAIALEMYRRQHLEQQQSQQQSAAMFSANAPPPFNPKTTTNTTTMNDESYARRLQQQEQDAQFAMDIQEQIRREEQLLSGGGGVAPLTAAAVTTEQDVEFALQVEQQLRDEDLARQMAIQEERNLQAQQQRAQTQAAANTPGQSSRRRFWSCLIPFVLVGAGMAIWWFLIANNGSTGNGGTIIPGGIPWLQDNDPFEGKNPGEVPKWDNGGRGIVQEGLQLTVVNAMESTWDDVFPLVLNDWDNGNPDTLALTVENARQSDPDCAEIMGKSKVCNGNYGNTQWKGINMVILDYNGYIAASTSKMNEYYLARASTVQRRYTLCHEIGHSFGLPHTDENFYNRDLGNCMDYTSNPAVNQQPDESNYLFLKDLYGVLPSWAEQTEAPDTVAPTDDGGRRLLRHNNHHHDLQSSSSSSFPDHIQSKIRELATHHSHSLEQLQQNGWRLLHSTNHGQEHEMELGDGWIIRMHKLLHQES